MKPLLSVPSFNFNNTVTQASTFIRTVPWWHRCKESACIAGDLRLIPEFRRALGKGMTTHCSILAWRIPWTEEPGGLQSMGLQTVGRD